ncbi:MAG: biopolymer transporter ExbD [Methanobrevibacter sp.]|uniref:ExbD/TolR family protein n=1 Tax=Methanobrevibacter sp. TaxID=66852 RepID=UPI0026DFC7F5|nr:biopolymer transporter ExbD [Methanobrevibacter sp.]MDO5848179.1 biopolymer transporter ExbD [Methanobrevibacter sp.]
MAIDVKSYKKRVSSQKPNFNLVPFIDILFTLMIFLVVTSSFAPASDVAATDQDGGTGKPNMTDSSGVKEYYVVPVANLHKVTVNGEDMSSMIKNNAIGVLASVMDKGEVNIKPGEIIITTPDGISPQEAVHVPN